MFGNDYKVSITISFGVLFLNMSMYYCSHFNRACPQGADWLPSTKPVHWAGMACAFSVIVPIALFLPTESATWMLGLAGNATVLSLYASPLASIRTVLAMKNTKYLPFDFTCSTFVACALGTYYSFYMINVPILGFANFAGMSIAAVQLALIARFGVHRG